MDLVLGLISLVSHIDSFIQCYAYKPKEPGRPSWSFSLWSGLWGIGQCNINGIFLAGYQYPSLSYAWVMPPSYALRALGRPLYQIMPCRSAGLAAIFLWFSGLALFCPRQSILDVAIRVSELRAVTSSSAILFCFLLLFLSLFMTQCAFLLCFSSILVFVCFFFPFLWPFPSVSISFDSSLLLLRCSSVALFIHSHSLPCCHFCLFVFCAFWSSFIWAVYMVGWQRHRHTWGHTQTTCRNTVIHRQTHTHTNSQTLKTQHRRDSQLYTHIHKHCHTVWLNQEEGCFQDESLYTVFISLPLLWNNSLQKLKPWQQPLQPWLWDLGHMTSL